MASFLDKLGQVGQVMSAANDPQLRQQIIEKQALQKLASQMSPVGEAGPQQPIDKQQALQKYAEITGDFNPIFGIGDQSPSAVREYQYFNSLSPEAKREYLTMKRSSQMFDRGGSQVIIDPLNPQQPIAEIDKTLKPGERPENIEEQEAAKVKGRADEEGRQSLPLWKRTLDSKELQDEFLNEKIDSIASRATPWTTGFTGTLAALKPGSPAYDLKADVETLLANSGFDRLQEMRDNSPTGGALGQVSERELGLLQAAAQNLQTSQSEEQFKRNLMAFKEQRSRSLQAIRQAYEEDVKRFGGENVPSLDGGGSSNKTSDDIVDYTEYFK